MLFSSRPEFGRSATASQKNDTKHTENQNNHKKASNSMKIENRILENGIVWLDLHIRKVRKDHV